jgi:Protein of unknown function (DUF3037)
MDFSFSYAVFRYIKDPQRDLSVPVGVALWSPDAQYVRFRFTEPSDRAKGINKTDDLPHIAVTERKLQDWIEHGQLPYQDRPMTPITDEWWRHVRNLLIHRIRMSEPLPIDCRDPERELEPLFTSVVGQEITRGRRIDSILRNALGNELAKKLHREPLEGFAGKPVQVMRAFKGATQDVVVEAVNLAAEDSPRQADEMVGKLQRVRCNGHGIVPKGRRLTAFVGYVSTPNGLNGETFLKDWIESAGNAKAFDLRSEQAELRSSVKRALEEASQELLESTG